MTFCLRLIGCWFYRKQKSTKLQVSFNRNRLVDDSMFNRLCVSYSVSISGVYNFQPARPWFFT